MPSLVLLSDTHDLHDQVQVPEADILIHSGDLTMSGTTRTLQAALDWLNKQPHQYVVCVAGNHDFNLEQQHKKQVLNFGRVFYLENDSVEIKGLQIYGSPFTPLFGDWAFMKPRGAEIRKIWDKIPTWTDVLITHGPPKGVLDVTGPQYGSESVGCEELAKVVKEIKPILNVFGHIHGSAGKTVVGSTTFVNASVVDEFYRVTNKPWVVEL